MNSSEELDFHHMTEDEIDLLKRLEEENRRIEFDLKSSMVNPINLRSTELHHRQDSITNETNHLTVDCDGHLEDEGVVWNKIVNNWPVYKKKKALWIKDLIRSGVPIHFRPLLWQCCGQVETSQAKELYATLIKLTSPCEKVIRRDITRTYPEHHLFKERNGLGQENLFNVLKVYSLYDREVGYCQGIGFIVGLLLMHMPEEEAFAVLVSMMQDYQLRLMYKHDMFYLGLCIYQLETMVQEFLPELHRHFQVEHFHTSMYASSWFLTLFTTQFPLNMACRMMDLFLSEGMEMIFRISLALLEIHQDELMLLSMEDMLKYFQKEVSNKHENDQESVFQRAFTVPYNGKKMKKLEKEYTVIRKDEQEEQIEIRKLRSENRLLKQRVENLEKESATLANRLIEGQVLNAQYAEESYQLKRENSNMKKQLDELSHSNVLKSDFLVQPNENELDVLRESVQRLTQENRRLQASPHAEIAHLQEELTQVKMRDAEAQVSLNELRQRLTDLNQQWQEHEQTCQITSEPSSDAYDLIAHELISLKMREAQLDCDNKLLSQKVMDIETQKQVLHNQIKRQDEELQRLRAELDQYRTHENDLRSQYNELKHQMCDGELRKKEDSMMLRIREAENVQAVADLRHRIAELEVQNQELITREQILDEKDLQDKLVELQDEVINLRLLQTYHRHASMSTDLSRVDYEESDNDGDDDDLNMNQSLSTSSASQPQQQNVENVRLSSSTGLTPLTTQMKVKNSLRQSTPSLFQSTPSIQSSNGLSSSQPL